MYNLNVSDDCAKFGRTQLPSWGKWPLCDCHDRRWTWGRYIAGASAVGSREYGQLMQGVRYILRIDQYQTLKRRIAQLRDPIVIPSVCY